MFLTYWYMWTILRFKKKTIVSFKSITKLKQHRMPFSVRCSSTALFTILLLNFPISKQSITAAMSIFQLQFPHLLRLWIWRLNIMKFKYDLVTRHQQIRLFLEQEHPWFLVQTVSDAKARDPLRTRKSSWRRRQGWEDHWLHSRNADVYKNSEG